MNSTQARTDGNSNAQDEGAIAQAMTQAQHDARAAERMAKAREAQAAKGRALAQGTQRKASPQGPASAPRQEGGNVNAPITLASIAALCPSQENGERMSQAFGLEPVDFDAIRATTARCIASMAAALSDNLVSTNDITGELNDRAHEIHVQRIVDGFVRSAYGAAMFYEGKAKVVRDLRSGFANQDRDEDRMGIDGGANKLDQAQAFAARVGLQALALLAAANGAADAYRTLFTRDWKPYAKTAAPAQAVDAKARQLRSSLFDKG